MKFHRFSRRPLVLTFAIAMLLPAIATAQPSERRGDGARQIEVGDDASLRQALAGAQAGTTIRIHAGDYRGGVYAAGLRGAPGQPIVIEAADPANPPVFTGGANSMHLAGPVHVEVRHLVLSGASNNGLNIDDGGTFESPARHIVLQELIVRDVGPQGNRDGIKLSGVVDFVVDSCTIERWGDGGSAVDMVGCHRGEIRSSTFRHRPDVTGSNAVQTKGGSSEIAIRHCRFEYAGDRAINIGGSTGMAFFRPRPMGYEAKDITVEDNTFIGSQSAAAFVGVDGAVMRFNTIYRPRRWVFRILQETRRPDFVPSRNGQFTDNLIIYRSDEIVGAVNIGPDTAPETFTLARNVWYSLDRPERSEPRLPIDEKDGRYGIDPGFVDAASGDLRLREDSPAAGAGARVK